MKINSFIIAIMLSSAASAVADPITIISNEIDITYDFTYSLYDFYAPDHFYLVRTTQGLPWDEDEFLPGSTVSVSAITNGVSLGFNNAMGRGAVGDGEGGMSGIGLFNLPLSFAAHPGYRIESYSITYSGTYFINTQSPREASVQLQGTGASFYDLVIYDTTAGGEQGIPRDTPFSVTGIIDGLANPNEIIISGRLEAYASWTTSWELMNLFNVASINLQSIQIVANIAAVPETSSYAMLLAGLGVLGLITRRRKKS